MTLLLILEVTTVIKHDCKSVLTLSLLITTKVPYANSLDLNEMPSNSASHMD